MKPSPPKDQHEAEQGIEASGASIEEPFRLTYQEVEEIVMDFTKRKVAEFE